VPTDAMPWGLRHFAEYQPFTPMIDSLRALTSGQSAGADLWLAVGWGALIAVVGYLWSRRLYTKIPTK
jgi:ABC-2 type transport system permease protein